MRIKKLFIFNFLAIIIVILIGELIAFAIEFNVLLKENAYTISDAFNYYKTTISNYNVQPYSIDNFRKPIILNKTDKNIILLGCSYTYGHKLNDNETFQYRLAKKTNMNVFNLAVSSTGLREMLHILRNKEILKELLSDKDAGKNTNQYEAEYVIYTYIDDHKRRLLYDLNEHSPHFKITKDNKLVLLKNKFYYCSFLYRQLKLFQFRYMSKQDIDNLLYIYIKQIANQIRNNFHNSENNPCEFIIFLFNNDDNINWTRISEIEGVRIIKLSDITDIDVSSSQFTISDTDVHPNASAWEVIVPALVKELNL